MILKQLGWLARKEETKLLEQKFRGRLAGVSWKYTQHLNGVVTTRLLIFIMSFLMFYRVISNKLFHDYFSSEMLIERVIFFVILMLAALLFNKFRVVSIILASLPIALIAYSYFVLPGQFNLRIIAFQTAVLLLILSGIYHNHKLKILGHELSANKIENQLVE